MKKLFLAAFLSVGAVAWAFGQSHFARGQELFMQNLPREAVSYLEITVAEDPSNVTAFLYLGIVYEQLGMLDEAITVYRQILGSAGNLTANVANNLANVFFRRGFLDDAEELYTRAIQADRTFAAAHLGRANIRLQRGDFRGAIADYEQYLAFAPRSPQRPEIERLILHIRGEFAEAERQQRAAEEAVRIAAVQAERQRMVEEEAARMAAVQAERQRLAEEEAAHMALLEMERVRREAEEEVERMRRAAEAEAERQRVAAEEAERLAAVEAERQRLAEAERQRLAAVEAERQRLAAEEAARLAAAEAERMRLAAEEAARLEAERRQRLLDEIAASLQAAAEGSQGMAVGAEGVERFEGEFELE